jgi:4-hydroxybenzoate polyprenyltransferase
MKSGHTDILAGDWIDRLAPAATRPYLRLARLDRPIGTWLLLFPCWWSTALAATRETFALALWYGLLFAVGAIVMRGAGCTINDLFDRDIDAKVERTRVRPLASGAISVPQALAFLALQLLIGLGVLLLLPPVAVVVGAASMLLVVPYPLMKRITDWPQAWLGLTFNWGALVGWTAMTAPAGRSLQDAFTMPPDLLAPVLLYIGGLFWTLGYDTIYAHQDKADDIKVGVRSTALRLGRASPRWIGFFYLLSTLLWAAASFAAHRAPLGLLAPALAAAHFIWQLRRWDQDDPASCLMIFRSNRFTGWLMLVGFTLAALATTA